MWAGPRVRSITTEYRSRYHLLRSRHFLIPWVSVPRMPRMPSTPTPPPSVGALGAFTGPYIGREAMLTFPRFYRAFSAGPGTTLKKIQLHSMGENSFLLSCIQFCGGTHCGGMSWRKRSDQERPIRSGISPKAPKYIRKLTFYPLLRGKSYIKKILDREPDITPHGLSRIWSPPEGAKQEIHR